MKLYIVYLLCIIIIVSGCIGIKHKPTKGSDNDYISFFINDSTTQYFIKPLTFATDDSKIWIDLTFRKSGKILSVFTCNYSIALANQLKSDNFEIQYNDKSIPFLKKQLLYKEVKKGKYEYRYSSELDAVNVLNLFENKYFSVKIDTLNFVPTRKTKSKMNKIQNNLFGFEIK